MFSSVSLQHHHGMGDFYYIVNGFKLKFNGVLDNT